MKLKLGTSCLLICLYLGQMHATGQAVSVSVALDTNTVTVGSATTLRVFAQVVPALRTSSERIFSWYVDVLNTNGAVAIANYAAMVKTASDRDPLTSSIGTQDGANRRAIYDTFLNLPGAGVNAPVELMAIPVSGASPGQTRFRIQAGTGAPLSSDFLVVPVGSGDPLTGGNYSLAEASLTVLASPTIPGVRLSMSVTNAPGGAKGVTLTFPTSGGFNYTVQFRDQLTTGAGWQPLPGAPHNSGSAFQFSNTGTRFYRVAVAPAN